MGRSISITLLRHGLTAENLQKKYIGWSDVPLCTQGRKELAQLKEQGYPQGDCFFISDLQRCQETFDILYEKKTNVTVSPLFRELNFGEWELHTYEQLKTNKMYRGWLENSRIAPIPNGEKFSNFETRILAGWSQIVSSFVKSTIKHLIIISHGGPIRYLLEQFAPEKKSFWEWQVNHGHGYTFTTTTDRLRRNERCISLQEVPFLGSENG